MSNYKLYYFNAKGRAEVTRWLFAIADVKYDDIRLTGEKWQEFKPKTPFGQMPVLEVDGKLISQSSNISKFIAKRLNLLGKTDVDQALVCMIVDGIGDMMNTFMKTKFGSDDAKKAAQKAWDEGERDKALTPFEKLLSSDYFVGDELTLADLHMAFVLGMFGDIDTFPKLKALKTRVESKPALAKWIANRPVTNM